MGVARVLLALEESDRPVELVRTLRDAGMDSDVAVGGETIARLAAMPCDVLVGPALASDRGILREAKGRFPDLEIVAVLKEAEAGVPVKEVCRKHSISSDNSGDTILISCRKYSRDTILNCQHF